MDRDRYGNIFLNKSEFSGTLKYSMCGEHGSLLNHFYPGGLRNLMQS